MCGICGYLNKQDTVDPFFLKPMMEKMIHRGPDDSGQYSYKQFSLGFRRLSIIDLTTGNQPISNESKTCWLLCNGEIYNHRTLKEELKARGHQFKTNTDVEVIVHLYEDYGKDLLSHLRGMFSFIVLDENKDTLFGARDHFGIKPLYYINNEQYFAFASEAKCLIPFLGGPEINTKAFLNYLTFQYLPAPMTIFKGLKKLPKAHCFTIDVKGELKIEKYWNLEFEIEERPFNYYTGAVKNILEESVSLHRQSDVPVGTFLSGGIDSSIVTAMLSRIQPVKSFSVGYSDKKYGQYSELSQAKELAKHLGIEWYHHVITPEEYWDVLQQAVWHLDEPLADPSAISLYFVARLASQQVKVVLTGEGADELFGGYRSYHQSISLACFDYLPHWIQRFANNLANRLPEKMRGRSFLLRGTTPLEKRFLGNANIFNEEQKRAAVSLGDYTGAYPSPEELTKPLYDAVAGHHDLTKMQYIDINLWLPDEILTKADRMSMAHSLELRVPFLDRAVAEVARKIPPRYLVTARGQTKQVLRQAVKDLLPANTINRAKLGFPVPTRVWLKEEFYPRVRALFEESFVPNFFNRSYLLDLLDQHKNGQRDNSRLIWVAVIFLIWHKQYLQDQPCKCNIVFQKSH